jgi:aminoglycoside phosphotransferase
MRLPESELEKALAWCTAVLGPVEVLSNASKADRGHESVICRLHDSNGFCYLKVHRNLARWQNEVHAYERWGGVFGDSAPRILAVHDDPLSLIINELPGQIMEGMQLPSSQERAVWVAAGAALAVLHNLANGEGFGPCLRDGTLAEAFPTDAREYMVGRFSQHLERAVQAGLIRNDELAILRVAYALIPAFEGERPVPCHRDYCTANWLINEAGTWAGVIDFEKSHWDLRAVDFNRDPDWCWIRRPDLFAAFLEGYGRPFTPAEKQQLLVAHMLYALDAILWGHEGAFYGFEREGHESLVHLASLLR